MAEFATTATDENGKDFRVLVNIPRVPLDVGERSKLIQDELDAKRYRLPDQTPAGFAGQTAESALRAMVNYAPPMAGIGMGAARGAQLGSALGPWGSAAGALGGGVLGGIAGYAGAKAGNTAMDVAEGQPTPPFDPMADVIKPGAMAGLQSFPPITVGMGAQKLVGGDPMGALEMGLGALGMRGARGPAPMAAETAADRAAVARQASVQNAQKLGIDLTAYEQTGTPLLRVAEAFASRSLGGAGVFRRFGQMETEQGIAAANRTATQTSGIPLGSVDVAYRGNRFLDMLNGRIDAAKRLRGVKEANYWNLANPASMVDISPLVQRAKSLMAENPSLPSLQNPKLNNVLEDIIAHGDPNASNPQLGALLQTMRRQLGLGPNEPIPFGQAGVPPELQAGAAPQMTLADLRRVRTAIGTMAYPESKMGAVIADLPTAQAKQLYGTISDMLGKDAAQRGPIIMPPAPGYVRLYRAEGPPESSSIWKDPQMAAYQGRWFDTSEANARVFAQNFTGIPHRARLTFVDVPQSVADSFRPSGQARDLLYGAPDTTRIVSPQVAATARNMTGPGLQPLPPLEAAWQDANQFRRVTMETLDGPLYRKLLGDKQSFYDFSKRLFNPNDPGPLLDAKATLSQPGWKLLQQQYWDYITNAGSTPAIKIGAGGELSFDAAGVARNLSRDRKILPHLFGQDQAQAMGELGSALQTASRTMGGGKDSVLMGILIGVGQGKGVESGLMQAAKGNVVGGMSKIAGVTLIPRALAYISTDPTAVRILVNAMRTGIADPGTIDSIITTLTRAEAVRANPPGGAPPE